MAKRGSWTQGWRPFAVGGAAIAVIALVAVVLYLTVFTVSVTVAGQRMRLRTGTTVGDLWTRGLIAAHPGDLVSARRRVVLKAGGGKPRVALVNSQSAAPSQQLRRSDVVIAENGANVVEKVSVRSEHSPFATRFLGVGPVETIVATGSPGLVEVRFGAVSREVVSTSLAQAPVRRVVRRSQPGPHAKLIALTFDDGPWPGQTRAVIKILLANNVRATFFEIGRQARAHPELSLALTEAGMLIGNHTETHDLTPNKLTTAQINAEINVAETNITKASGQRPRYFRPPGGTVVPAMYPALARAHLKMVLWDVDTNDWKRPAAATIVNRVVAGARPGAVILMHEGGGDRSHTIAALPAIIKKLKAAGYVFVTLDALKHLPRKMG